jgi:hypothetical protein
MVLSSSVQEVTYYPFRLQNNLNQSQLLLFCTFRVVKEEHFLVLSQRVLFLPFPTRLDTVEFERKSFGKTKLCSTIAKKKIAN